MEGTTDHTFVSLCDDGSRDRKQPRNPYSLGNRDKYKSDRAEGVGSRAMSTQFFPADSRTGSTWDVASNATDHLLHRVGKGGHKDSHKEGGSSKSGRPSAGHSSTSSSATRDVVLTDNVEEIERKMLADAPKANPNYQLDDVFDVAYREMQFQHNHGGQTAGTVALGTATSKPQAPQAPQKKVENPVDEFDF